MAWRAQSSLVRLSVDDIFAKPQDDLPLLSAFSPSTLLQTIFSYANNRALCLLLQRVLVLVLR
jgi:hypothetical protein